jgi:phosphatidate cytidylyltransferase
VLRQRIITALVLLAILLPALFASASWPFALVTLVMIGAAGWEWGRLNGQGGAVAAALGLLLTAMCGAALAAGWVSAAPRGLWWLASLAWVVGGAVVLRAGVQAWPRLNVALRLALGLLLLWAGWLALAQARSIGINFILSVLCLVWMADVAAYFGGRALGRRKLAPTISPGKSWEGVWSGRPACCCWPSSGPRSRPVAGSTAAASSARCLIAWVTWAGRWHCWRCRA